MDRFFPDTYGVTEINFDDIGVCIHTIDCGAFSGSAVIDTDGRVVHLYLEGWRGDRKMVSELGVLKPMEAPQTFDEHLARELAISIQRRRSDDIQEALNDWFESVNDGPEYDANDAEYA